MPHRLDEARAARVVAKLAAEGFQAIPIGCRSFNETSASAGCTGAAPATTLVIWRCQVSASSRPNASRKGRPTPGAQPGAERGQVVVHAQTHVAGRAYLKRHLRVSQQAHHLRLSRGQAVALAQDRVVMLHVAGDDVDQRTHLNFIGVIFQPPVYSIPRQRGCQNKCDKDKFSKFARKEYDNAGHGCPQHFADADLLCALFRSERGERK